MPTDTLGSEAQGALKSAAELVRLNRPDDRRRRTIMAELTHISQRLRTDVAEREDSYLRALQIQEDAELEEISRDLNDNPRFVRASSELKSRNETFQDLRKANNGAYPKNISPVIYAIPLIFVGVAEWYVNLSTFMARFVPLVAAAGTILVAGIFAAASHFQGEFLKQISEVFHPSAIYRNELGRKLIVAIASLLLVAAFVVVIWLRYQVIAEQLGLTSNSAGTFGVSNNSIVWQNLGPTIGLNLFVWGLGVLYASLMSEKIPKLRETFRDLRRSEVEVDRIRKPFVAEQKRIHAQYERERKKNAVMAQEYRSLAEEIDASIKRLQACEVR
ncbi:hypothetical protein JQ557_27945 [Bradyrhizobium sp. U87765 SZCCT0131]|uniref:hypothetical protein n=1 Tax=unclassified Bradyrhizobium TaxID=2631580 RepID=UPI001BAD6E4C|nr:MULTISPECIES: hypothetical protein [unclassified Bradyrhizobium]MBR1221864.1 hypothetical protein [Bradyrhizobium sp. U87765 SZCCT0131]MBR1263938.1 hypothetical protein [Bradyrhizobium sp. U87765 SZCCT0134]MBR1302492.1 hypothetical protein [Bradyrhizobium sp. U87765 SZCCT0110]MBR1320188.1 hypothetical protein [Bradyrhizobium sp. U87765 SZCCT0109]MBR1348699.1 hypothetical protein [Bradyrhizobium sp. U87765 SZCCT0048]